MSIERRLKELGLALPDPPKPAGNYVPWLVSGNLLFLSGQFPIENSRLLYTGRVGAELTEDQVTRPLASQRPTCSRKSAPLLAVSIGSERFCASRGMLPPPLVGTERQECSMAGPTSLLPCLANAVPTRAPRSLQRSYR